MYFINRVKNACPTQIKNVLQMQESYFTAMCVIGIIVMVHTVSAQPPSVLPEANHGIASHYPFDEGIEKNDNVIFAESFETYSSIDDLKQKWDVLINSAHLNLALDEDENRDRGTTLMLSLPRQEIPLTTGLSKILDHPSDVLFLRWEMKFDQDWFVPNGSVHNGGTISSNYYVNGQATPGKPANGRNKYLVNFENENSLGSSLGLMNVYIYWPEQGDQWGDHFFPSGLVMPFSNQRSGAASFGEHFIERQDIVPECGSWHCYEYMVKVNTPGKRDGRIAMWVDGELIGDFPNLRLRDIAELQIDRFGFELYIANNSDRLNRKWHDNIVAAYNYIGPRVQVKP